MKDEELSALIRPSVMVGSFRSICAGRTVVRSKPIEAKIRPAATLTDVESVLNLFSSAMENNSTNTDTKNRDDSISVNRQLPIQTFRVNQQQLITAQSGGMGRMRHSQVEEIQRQKAERAGLVNPAPPIKSKAKGR